MRGRVPGDHPGACGRERERLTQSSTMLLTGALGAVFIILTLYADIFAFERKAYVIQWFAGWMIIAFNYVLDAFFPDLLRGNRLMFLFSAASYFFANFLIFYGNCSFLDIKIHKPFFIEGVPNSVEIERRQRREGLIYLS